MGAARRPLAGGPLALVVAAVCASAGAFATPGPRLGRRAVPARSAPPRMGLATRAATLALRAPACLGLASVRSG